MFVKFESLWENFDEILDYVGMEDMVDELPAKKQRSTKIEDVLSHEEIKALQKTYSSLIKKFEDFPDFLIF